MKEKRLFQRMQKYTYRERDRKREREKERKRFIYERERRWRRETPLSQLPSLCLIIDPVLLSIVFLT